MKNRLVLWGENEANDKVLITLDLKEKENNVEVKVIPQNLATEDLYNDLMNKWKNDEKVDFPDGTETIQRPLSISESILPDHLKSDRADLLTRAQAEWHFTDLSEKLFQMYKSELDEYKEKVDALTEYSEDVWSEMKAFWEKVQNQVRERNMFRDQAATLKERTNTLFDKLKALRKEMRKELDEKSGEISQSLLNQLEEIEAKVKEGLALNPIFDELKQLQNKFFKQDLNKKDKDKVWNKLDGLFKEVKEARFGDKGKGNKSGSRLKSRYDGLLKAIQRMQNSIAYDEKDVAFQHNKISTTDGQLEMQIRQAKLIMIEERLNSKKNKLEDMLKTKIDLEKQMEKEKQKLEKEKLEQEKAKIAEGIKEKIAAEITENKKELEDQASLLKKAAEEIQASKASATSISQKASEFLDKAIDKVEQIAEDVVDTASAISEVIEDKIEAALGEEE